MTTIQAALFLGKDVIVNMPSHTKDGQTGKLIKVQTHSWTVLGLEVKPLCTVCFPNGEERVFFPKSLEVVRQPHEQVIA